MMISPILAEALESAAVAIVGSSIVAPLASWLKHVIGVRRRKVTLKLASGERISLELDRSLSQERVSELVASAIISSQSGDQAAVRRAVDASHAASSDARALASH